MSLHSHSQTAPLRREGKARRAKTQDALAAGAGREQADSAQAEATAARQGRRRTRGWRSPLTRRILTINVLVLLIPVLGLMHLDQYRDSLIAAEIDALRIQGRAFSLSLGSTAVVATQVGDERLLPEVTRNLMRVLLVDTGVRARIFARSGEILADSFVLGGPGGQVQVQALPPQGDRGFDLLRRLLDLATKWVPGKDKFPLYTEPREQQAKDYAEVMGALAGQTAAGAYQVKCDSDNNPIAQREQGQLLVEIQIAPAVPFEFIRIRFGKTLDAIEVTE